MLESIHSPADVRALTGRQAQALAQEIREKMIDAVASTGGHLASNLGTVELTLAMHRALDTPRDKIVFDVGHQSYTHKLITDRQALLSTLRCEGGISGFPKREESEYDVFETGHASTALSAALGIARARDLMNEDFAVVAVVGDGALTGGMCYEALNDAGSRPTPLVMVLNDNEMSIGHNVGALSTYLTKLRGSPRWGSAKRAVKKGLLRLPLVGDGLTRVMERVKRTLRLMFVPGEFFEALGFGYLGPVDGHDIATIEQALRDAKAMRRPIVVHVVTQKGRGYERAERKPEKFHGVSPFFVKSGVLRKAGSQKSVTRSAAQIAGECLVELAAQDARIVAITAAMAQGTGLAAFAKAYPDRFFDVGIAEEHAMTLAAGFAVGGMRPVFAVYATFLQRAIDQLAHDVCLQGLPVVVLADHAGFVPGDGATHQGVYDLAMLRALPGLTIWAPCDGRELRAMLRAAFSLEGPCVIRCPKALPLALDDEELARAGSWRRIGGEGTVAIIGYGRSVQAAMEVARVLRQGGVCAEIWSASTLSEMDGRVLGALAGRDLVVTLEDAQAAGGLGEAVAAWYAVRGERVSLLALAVEGIAPGAHSVGGLRAQCGLDTACVVRRIQEALDGRK